MKRRVSVFLKKLKEVRKEAHKKKQQRIVRFKIKTSPQQKNQHSSIQNRKNCFSKNLVEWKRKFL